MRYLLSPVAIIKGPSDAPSDAEWAVKYQVKYQVVLPKLYCNEVLSMDHETPLAGHLGVSNFTIIY